MSADPLTITFEILAGSGRAEAEETLLAALDVPAGDVRDRAAAAIVGRGYVRGLIELLRRFCELPVSTRRLLATGSDSLGRAFRQSLKHGDEELILSALAAARSGGHADQLPDLVSLLTAESRAVRDEAADAVWCLAERLHDLAKRNGRNGRLDATGLRDDALHSLAAACDRFERLPEPTRVLEPLLALGSPRHPAVAKVLRQSSVECRKLAADLLATSRHPGVLRLFFEFLGESYPPRRLFETLQTRDDPEFIAATLRWLPDAPTATQAANLRQVEAVAWLDEPERIVDLPEALQGRVPRFVLATGLPDARKMELQEWVVRNASAEGRRGATQVLDRLDVDTTRRILLDSLASEDEDVSAWATSQLRSRHVPGAFRLLVERLESPSESVRRAAREELQGFTIEHLVAVHERLTPPLCRQAGELVRKVDPDCLGKLASMIGGPVQRQRVTAARAVVRLGLGEEMRHALLGLLSDEDNVIRRLGIELLADDRSPEVGQALREMRSDPSPRVRQAAERALESVDVPAASIL